MNAAQLAAENKAKSERIKGTGAATVNQLNDDELAMRQAAADKSAADKAAYAAQLAAENKAKAAAIAATGAATDHQLA